MCPADSVGRMPIITMCAPTSAALASASLRLARTPSSNSVKPRSLSCLGGTLISRLNWPSSVWKSGSAIASSASRVLQRRVTELVDEVELDLQPGHRGVRVEARLAQHPREHVEAAPHLLAVARPVLAGELLLCHLFAHGRSLA